MLIPAVDDALAALLRGQLPLPAEVGDVSFEAPSVAWSAQLSRVTVNLFLHRVGRSGQARPPAAHRTVDGVVQRRPPQPMLRLGYLVSAWAGTVRDEHHLLSEVLACFLANQVVPADLLPEGTAGPVQLALPGPDGDAGKDFWEGWGGQLKPSFGLEVTCASDALAWAATAERVARIEGLVAPVPGGVPVPDGADRHPPAQVATLREGGRLVVTARQQQD